MGGFGLHRRRKAGYSRRSNDRGRVPVAPSARRAPRSCARRGRGWVTRTTGELDGQGEQTRSSEATGRDRSACSWSRCATCREARASGHAPGQRPGCRLTRLGQELRRSSWESSPRELTPAFANTLRRWNATVRGETQHWAAMSLFDKPVVTSCATFCSTGVSCKRVDGSRLRAVSPEARSSWVVRAMSGPAFRSVKISSAARSWVRASTRRWVRRRNSP